MQDAAAQKNGKRHDEAASTPAAASAPTPATASAPTPESAPAPDSAPTPDSAPAPSSGPAKANTDRMGTERIGKLLLEFSIPAIISMVFNLSLIHI